MFLTKEFLSLQVGSSLRRKKNPRSCRMEKNGRILSHAEPGKFQCCFCVKCLVRLPGATPAWARIPELWARNSEL